MKFLEKLYRSKFGLLLSITARTLLSLHKPRMIYGYRDCSSGIFRKYTRTSSTLVVMSPENLKIDDHVWIWHHSIIDATEILQIDEGVQIGAWVGIFTHGSETAIRLLGNNFINIPNAERPGYIRGE